MKDLHQSNTAEAVVDVDVVVEAVDVDVVVDVMVDALLVVAHPHLRVRSLTRGAFTVVEWVTSRPSAPS